MSSELSGPLLLFLVKRTKWISLASTCSPQTNYLCEQFYLHTRTHIKLIILDNYIHRADLISTKKCTVCTVCQRSSDPFYLVTYYIKWVTTSWTHSIIYNMDIRNQKHSLRDGLNLSKGLLFFNNMRWIKMKK